jgi:hypothetical protein
MLASIQHNDEKLTEFLVISALLGNYNSVSSNSADILAKWGDKLLQGSPETLFATAILTSRSGNTASTTDSLANSH